MGVLTNGTLGNIATLFIKVMDAAGFFDSTLDNVLKEWNDTIWTVMIEKGIVYPDGHIKFVFYNGTEIEVGA